MKPDSQESFLPSQRGRTRKRRIKRPRMLAAQARAKSAAEIEIEAAEEPGGVQKADAEADGAMVERDEGEGEKRPEDEGVGEAGQRALADDFGLAEDFPEEVPDALADGEEVEAGVFFRFEDLAQDHAEATPEAIGGGEDEAGEDQLLRKGKVQRLSEGGEREDHNSNELNNTGPGRDVS